MLDALLVGVGLGLLSAAVPLPDGAAYTLLLGAALVLYETSLLASGGRTLGKMLFGLRVVRADRAPLAPRDALIRSAVVDAIGLVPLGWAIAAIVLEKQRLRQGPHDRAASTLVVTTRRPA